MRLRARCGIDVRRADLSGPPVLPGLRGTAYVLVLLLSASTFAQQPTPTFRSSTLLIVQTVTVKDKKGQPIAGLTAKDFIVTEDGVPQEIAFVEYQKLDAPPLGAIDLGPDRGQTTVRPQCRARDRGWRIA